MSCEEKKVMMMLFRFSELKKIWLFERCPSPELIVVSAIWGACLGKDSHTYLPFEFGLSGIVILCVEGWWGGGERAGEGGVRFSQTYLQIVLKD